MAETVLFVSLRRTVNGTINKLPKYKLFHLHTVSECVSDYFFFYLTH